MVEQDAIQKRESLVHEVITQKLREEQLRSREHFDKLRIGFDLEAIRFEKQMQEKAFDLVRSLKVKQLDLLINVSRRLVDLKRMLKTGEPCIEAVTQLQQLVDQNM